MLDKLIDYIRNFDFKAFITKLKERDIKGEVKEKTKEIVEDAQGIVENVKEKEEDFVYRAKHWKLFENFDIEQYTSLINFKLIGILALVVIVLFAIVVLIRFTGIYNDKKYEEFNNQIDLVEEKIITIYDKEEEKIGKTTTNLGNKWKYRKVFNDIKNEFGKDLTSDKYYLLGKEEKEKLGLSELKNEYIVNYETSEVFSMKSIKYKGKKYYTSIKIENALKGTATYNLPPIPKGFRHIEGMWNTGFVIKDQHGNEFVWVPVGYLNKNDATQALKRYYDSNTYKKSETEEYNKILESIKKYQGFYIGRYEASLQGATDISDKGTTNILQVVKNAIPISRLSYSTNKKLIDEQYQNKKLYGYDENGNNSSDKTAKGAYELAVDMAFNYDWGENGVHTTLLYAEQYDTLLKIIETLNLLEDKKVDDSNPITYDSSYWGNYMNSKITYKKGEEFVTKNENEGVLLPTGIDTYKEDNQTIANSNKVFNIYDLAGNLSEWTNEKVLDVYNVTRGGNFCSRGNNLNVANYDRQYSYISSNSIGIRVALYID